MEIKGKSCYAECRVGCPDGRRKLFGEYISRAAQTRPGSHWYSHKYSRTDNLMGDAQEDDCFPVFNSNMGERSKPLLATACFWASRLLQRPGKFSSGRKCTGKEEHLKVDIQENKRNYYDLSSLFERNCCHSVSSPLKQRKADLQLRRNCSSFGWHT